MCWLPQGPPQPCADRSKLPAGSISGSAFAEGSLCGLDEDSDALSHIDEDILRLAKLPVVANRSLAFRLMWVMFCAVASSPCSSHCPLHHGDTGWPLTAACCSVPCPVPLLTALHLESCRWPLLAALRPGRLYRLPNDPSCHLQVSDMCLPLLQPLQPGRQPHCPPAPLTAAACNVHLPSTMNPGAYQPLLQHLPVLCT